MDLLERDDELRRLHGAFARASAGSGRIVAITGEAGAGKTALVERFTGSANVNVYWGACEHLSTPEPLLPLHDVARAAGGRFVFDPAADHLQSFDALLRLLTSEMSILVFEDIHWADTATLDLIRFLGRRIVRSNALVVLTYRDDDAKARGVVRDMLGDVTAGTVERISLAPLSVAAVTQLASRKGRPGDQLHALTGGNPFFVTELLAVDDFAPTDAVRDATLARAARLPQAARDVLAAVSIFPRHADSTLVAALAGEGAAAGIDFCVDGGMLVADVGTLRFRHEIARQALEDSLPAAQRCRLHERLVDLLRARPHVRPSEVAHHAARAGDIASLLVFAQRAGDDAARAGAPREAAAHYASMLAHRSILDDGTAMHLLERYAEQCYLSGASDVALTAMLEAKELRHAQGDVVGVGRDLVRLTRFAWTCGRRKEAEKFVEQAIEVLRDRPPGAELAWAYSHRSQLDMLAFDFDSAIEWGERALQLAESLGEREIVIHAMTNVGTARSKHNVGDETLRRALELARESGHHDHVERSACNLACASYWRRDDEAARAYVALGVDYAVDREITHWETYLRGWGAMIDIDQGEDWDGVGAELERLCATTGVVDLFRFPALFALARLRVRRGDPDVAAPLEAARPVAANLGELQRQIYVAACDAERAWLTDEGHDEAIDALQSLLTRARAKNVRWIAEDAIYWLHLLGAPVTINDLAQPYADHCAGKWLEAAAAWRARKRPYEEAIALSFGDEEAQRTALSIFDRLGAAPAAARLRRQMRSGGVRTIPRGPIAGTRANPGGLTRRQVQVLALLADELTNAEIADRLCISAKTAEHHVAAIMARLDARTRHEAAATARERGFLSVSEK
ncbi:ATP-binding protein [Roseiterribacter gracilis]|uniref:LuxR family transcriptional regulator n=1 Tax=Roseiterribacter gracilis TaxID=2812848 RepID=A0A8S8XFU2_9PROT|nr:LuxR family transcriptional regulator [Rhodospirillales bacterium TMPK1]